MKISMLPVLFFIFSCGSLGLSPAEMPTYNLLEQTKEICAQTLTNEVTAQTKCFPLLNDQELLVKVNKINLSTYVKGVTLATDVGPKYDVLCELSVKAYDQLMKNPDSIQVGLHYKVKGRFSRYAQYVEHGIFTLTECEAMGPVSIK